MEKREQWGSRLGFIFAAAGSAIGLGNIWRFPTRVGENGGGAFVLIYLLIMFAIGIPVMISEFVVGRKGQKNIVGSFTSIKNTPLWYGVGFMGVLSGFLILSFYSVVAGWGVSYIFKFITGTFTGNVDTTEIFIGLITDPIQPLFWHLVFMGMTTYIVLKGIGGGIEKYSKLLMPALLGLLVLLAIRSLTLSGAWEGVVWYLKPDFSAITTETILASLGQVFFSLSLGMGAMITYGSYLSKKEDIPVNALLISLADLFIAVLAGFIIIPAVFAFGFEPGAGAGLVFMTLPAVFEAMPFGSIFGFLFFVLLTIAALTSAISFLEAVVAYFIDEVKWDRKKATLIIGTIIFLMGVPVSLSQGGITIANIDFLDLFDNITALVFLPLGGLMTVIFVGWVWGGKNALSEIEQEGVKFKLGNAWLFLVKYILPVVLFYILASGLYPVIKDYLPF
ncbi:neurotransmitter:Na+ symporter, NSS family [Anaerobranca californiensis DSM 14826]|jgi:NSS family neurotransmitter:Na+ symporter|uniref:Neurotransmitter:Na+ symporter, NSS family n=1 Tax=Anaerobranca californiensis DSM 14826 TaxID=1120989 RepID=A0A1M6NS24_9FIRM|nr:sodium-dependent transporter [Anaerobranca californiensis]SHJ98537.1 neurotransmitter:Na+ symporter, NSS family [Anaerobranca californiensis DSM 14826]